MILLEDPQLAMLLPLTDPSGVLTKIGPKTTKTGPSEPKIDCDVICNGTLLDREIGVEKVSYFEKQEARR